MAKAFLITGFSSWGKTTLIKRIFSQQRFSYTHLYTPYKVNIDKEFIVQSQSNDDLHESKYIEQINRRFIGNGSRRLNLIAAFCPTIETNNNSARILRHRIFNRFSEIHIMLLANKWDHHAFLNLENVVPHLESCNRANIFIHIINDDDNSTDFREIENLRFTQIINLIRDNS